MGRRVTASFETHLGLVVLKGMRVGEFWEGEKGMGKRMDVNKGEGGAMRGRGWHG
jgi:hypothetical protein